MFSKRIVLVAFAILGVAALAGCGSSSKKSESSTTTTPAQSGKAAFCADNAKMNAALTGSTPSDYVQTLKDNSSTIEDFEKNAPAEIKADAQTLAAAARKSIQDNAVDALQGTEVQAAGQKVDAFCGESTTATTVPDGTTETTAG